MSRRLLIGAAGAAACCAAVAVAIVAVVAMAASAAAGPGVGAALGPPAAPSGQALADIPPAYLTLYLAAAQRYGLDWSILAAIGKVECDHGRDPDPSCTHEGSLNYAGAGGPAQFLLSTWQQYGVDGDGNGTRDMWSAPDAIFAMGRYLRASGAPSDYGRAIFAYNGAGWYVQKVLSIAAGYRAAAADAGTVDVIAQGYVSPIPAGARLSWMRIDQGQDLQTDPGIGLRAIGDGYVTKAVDPGGFGPDYAVLHLTAGPQAGRSYYYGHTHVAVLGPVHSGEVICHTGTRGVGNATSPGWAEVGLWPPGDMSAGAAVAPFLRSLPRV
ncbi:MAG: lytic murein transglycosylase [Solirubrobacteraceae bacterium]